ncbi:hypothetical protein [Marinicella sp. W31]|uniref:hypothetical protein n=1 Tax=Marinicella sp. W31 TaxID=3023713 RepID=UPI003757140D
MKTIILINILLISPHFSLAQDDGDLIDDSWNQYQQCLERNSIDLFDDLEKLSSRLMSNDMGKKDSYWITIGAGYKKVIRRIIESSIHKTYSKLEIVKDQVNEDWRISSHLENLFFFHFNQGYIETFDLQACRKIEGENDHADYSRVLKPTVELIRMYKKRNHTEHSDCTGYTSFDYLLKIAILMYKPELGEYVTNDVIKEKSLMRLNDKETEEDLNEMWKIIGSN